MWMSLQQCCYMTETWHSGFPHPLTNEFKNRDQSLELIDSLIMLSVKMTLMGEEDRHRLSEIYTVFMKHIFICTIDTLKRKALTSCWCIICVCAVQLTYCCNDSPFLCLNTVTFNLLSSAICLWLYRMHFFYIWHSCSVYWFLFSEMICTLWIYLFLHLSH